MDLGTKRKKCGQIELPLFRLYDDQQVAFQTVDATNKNFTSCGHIFTTHAPYHPVDFNFPKSP